MKKFLGIKRICAGVLAAAMMMGTAPALRGSVQTDSTVLTASAANSDAIELKSINRSVTLSGNYVVKGNVEIGSQIKLAGDTVIHIEEGAKLRATIVVGNGHDLIVTGGGKMVIDASYHTLGLNAITVHQLIVNGPDVTVYGGDGTANNDAGYVNGGAGVKGQVLVMDGNLVAFGGNGGDAKYGNGTNGGVGIDGGVMTYTYVRADGGKGGKSVDGKSGSGGNGINGDTIVMSGDLHAAGGIAGLSDTGIRGTAGTAYQGEMIYTPSKFDVYRLYKGRVLLLSEK